MWIEATVKGYERKILINLDTVHTIIDRGYTLVDFGIEDYLSLEETYSEIKGKIINQID